MFGTTGTEPGTDLAADGSTARTWANASVGTERTIHSHTAINRRIAYRVTQQPASFTGP